MYCCLFRAKILTWSKCCQQESLPGAGLDRGLVQCQHLEEKLVWLSILTNCANCQFCTMCLLCVHQERGCSGLSTLDEPSCVKRSEDSCTLCAISGTSCRANSFATFCPIIENLLGENSGGESGEHWRRIRAWESPTSCYNSCERGFGKVNSGWININ